MLLANFYCVIENQPTKSEKNITQNKTKQNKSTKKESEDENNQKEQSNFGQKYDNINNYDDYNNIIINQKQENNELKKDDETTDNDGTKQTQAIVGETPTPEDATNYVSIAQITGSGMVSDGDVYINPWEKASYITPMGPTKGMYPDLNKQNHNNYNMLESQKQEQMQSITPGGPFEYKHKNENQNQNQNSNDDDSEEDLFSESSENNSSLVSFCFLRVCFVCFFGAK